MGSYYIPERSLYLAYSPSRYQLKIGASCDPVLRWCHLKWITKDLILIGYTSFGTSKDILNKERDFSIKCPSGKYFTDWMPFSFETINKFRAAENSFCLTDDEIRISKISIEGPQVDKDLKNKIKSIRDRIGDYQGAFLALTAEGISMSTAQKLLAGSYPSKPQPLLLQAIERAMKRAA